MAKNTDRSKSALERRRERQNNRGKGVETADWESVNSDNLVKLIARVTLLKGTITFGYTRDGGAYYISYYMDGESEKLYVRPTEDVDNFILSELESFQ